MNKLTKYFALVAIALAIPVCANAEIVVKDTVTPEFIHNQGYSSEVNRIIKVKTKDPATPIPAEEKNSRWKKFGWYVWKTVDPSISRPGEFVNHDSVPGSSINDL
jgi:hypothetical protein